MDVSTVISIQNQLVTHINKTIKASTDDEIVVDKTILTCCPADTSTNRQELMDKSKTERHRPINVKGDKISKIFN